MKNLRKTKQTVPSNRENNSVRKKLNQDSINEIRAYFSALNFVIMVGGAETNYQRINFARSTSDNEKARWNEALEDSLRLLKALTTLEADLRLEFPDIYRDVTLLTTAEGGVKENAQRFQQAKLLITSYFESDSSPDELNKKKAVRLIADGLIFFESIFDTENSLLRLRQPFGHNPIVIL